MERSNYLPEQSTGLGKTIAEIVTQFGAGAASLGTTTAVGEPLAGIGAGIATGHAGKGLVGALFKRRTDRIVRTVSRAEQRIWERLEDHQQLRREAIEDEIQAFEVVEAALNAAVGSTEQRKAELIGSVIASAAFDESVSIADLQRFLKLLETLSWRQIVSLVYFADTGRLSERQLIAAGGENGIGQIWPGLEAELAELGRGYELIGFIEDDEAVTNPSNVWGGGQITAANLDKIGLTALGQTLYRLAEMEELVSTEDIDDFSRRELQGQS